MAMKEIFCNQGPEQKMRIFYAPEKEHSGVQEFLCPYCHKKEQWQEIPGRIFGIQIQGRDGWEPCEIAQQPN
jgi:hypothetical protein